MRSPAAVAESSIGLSESEYLAALSSRISSTCVSASRLPATTCSPTPDVTIGRHAQLRNVVIDRGVVIPEGLIVGEDPVLDASRFRRSENGICLITQAMIDKLDL